MARLGLDRRRMSRVDGLQFWRLMGTGAGSRTGPGADLHRSAVFAVWRDEAALDAFGDEMSTRWQGDDIAESWHVRLRGRGGHGTWRGFDVLGALEQAHDPDGPVAAITRADVHLRSWRDFRRAGAPVSDELQTADGLLAVVGVGEAPVGRLGTFSLWRDLAAMRAYAHGLPQHREVVRRTRRDDWYGEELFARFEPYASRGTWDGRDPLRTGTSMP